MLGRRFVLAPTLAIGLAIGLTVVTASGLITPDAQASGSVGAGSSGINLYGALYNQGKTAFFGKLACDGGDCPIRKDALDHALAMSLIASLASRAEVKFESNETDAIVSRLCPGENASNCDGKIDEQQAVQYYLSRRFGVRQ